MKEDKDVRFVRELDLATREWGPEWLRTMRERSAQAAEYARRTADPED